MTDRLPSRKALRLLGHLVADELSDRELDRLASGADEREADPDEADSVEDWAELSEWLRRLARGFER